MDYYNARYYDPVAGVFLSADSAQGNGQGMNPYGYVGGNPETWSDPTGRYIVGLGGEHGYVVPDDNGGKTIELFYANGWEVVHHVNAQGNLDAANGHPANGKTAHCVTWCGDVKDPVQEVLGVTSLGTGSFLLLLAIGLLRGGNLMSGLQLLASSSSDMLYGLHLLATNHTDVNPHFLLALDTVKFAVDTVQVLLLLANIGKLVTTSGPGRTLLDKLGWIGRTIQGWFTKQEPATQTLNATAQAIIGNFQQIVSPQSGSFFPVTADWLNMQRDEQAIPAYDSESF